MSDDDIVDAKNDRDKRIAAHLERLETRYSQERNPFKKFWLALKIGWWQRALMT